MNYYLKKYSSLAVLALFISFVSQFASAQTGPYPNRPIKIIIPFPPGNTTDIMTRLIAPKLQERLGQAIIVENKPGGAGTVGMEFVAKSKPDGYTLVASQGGNMVVLPHTSKNVPYNPITDFTSIALSTYNYQVITASNQTPFKTFSQMIEWAKANPGQLTVASNGEGGFPHIVFEHLAKTAGITFTHVPYKGSAQIVTDMVGGQVMTSVDGVSGPAPHIRSGSIRLLAISNKSKVPEWPNTPTVSETITGWTSNGWFGYSGPAGMNKDIVRKLNVEINRAMNSPEVVEQLKTYGLEVVSEPPEYYDRVLREDYARYGKLVKDINYVPH
jgi:tripartite-type tricarboxylate transporter receptor subunit TctC